MAVQLTVFSAENPASFLFKTDGVPLGRVVRSDGGPVYVRRKRINKPPRVWSSGFTLHRISITGRYDVATAGQDALEALYTLRDEEAPVRLVRPRLAVDQRSYLIEVIEVTESEHFEESAQFIDYSITLVEDAE